MPYSENLPDMITEINKNPKYLLLKAFKDEEPVLIRSDDGHARQSFRSKYENKDLWVWPNLYTAPDLSAEQICPLRFHIVAENLMQARKNTIEACYYITENFAIPEDGVEVICNRGEGIVGSIDSNAVPTAEMVTIISPLVFGSPSTQLMPVINYHLARNLVRAGIKNIDIDVYQRDKLLRMPNSFNSALSGYVIPLTCKELLYLSPDAIINLAQNPRPEDSMVIPRHVPEAVDWFTMVFKDIENNHKKQEQLLNLIFQKGWETPPCIRRLQRLCLNGNVRLEAYRIIAQFYSWIKSSVGEIWFQIQDLDQRNPIKNYQKLKAIIAFAFENPQFAGCEHKLLKRFCPAGKCFMAKLIKECEKPHLFEPI